MNNGSSELTIDDLFVGQKFVSAEHKVTVEEIKEFAEKYDPQPFHTDEEAAKKTFFRGLSASGWMTAAITMRLTVACVPIKGGLIGANMEIAWPNPTRPGDVLHVESEILEVNKSQTHPGRGTILVRNTTLNQDGKVAQIQTGKLIISSR